MARMRESKVLATFNLTPAHIARVTRIGREYALTVVSRDNEQTQWFADADQAFEAIGAVAEQLVHWQLVERLAATNALLSAH